MTNKNFRLMFTIYFITFGVVIALFGSLIGYQMQTINIKDNFDIKSQESYIVKKFNVIQPSIERLDTTVTALAQNSLLYEFITNPTQESKKDIQHIFHVIANSNNLIMQARYINAKGKEVVRVDRVNKQDAPFIVEDAALQDKSNRDYFQIVSKLKTQKVWHSKLDLNIEHGKIEVPYRPTMRAAVPIYIDDTFQGIVIVNMLMENLLKNFKNSNIFDIFLIDKDGNFILHTNNKYSWNKYTGTQRKLSTDFPYDASEILAGASKGKDFFAFNVNDILDNEDNAVMILKPKKDYEEQLFASNIKTTALILILSILISIPLAIYASFTPSKLQKALIVANDELKRFAEIIDKHVITATTKTNSIITSVSSAFVSISGYKKEELIGEKMNIIRHPDTQKNVFVELWNTVSNGEIWHGELKNRSKDGGAYWVEEDIVPIKDKNDTIVSYMAISNDITAQKELEKISITDKLTGMYNRRKFDECLNEEVDRARRYAQNLSLIIIDIDHFKSVNDTYGHQTGDDVLATTAHIITEHIRKIDIAGRYGGEEFVVICPNTDLEQAALVAEKLRAMVAKHTFNVVGQKTISLGVAEFSVEDNPEDLIKKADSALYKAKNEGRNRVIKFEDSN